MLVDDVKTRIEAQIDGLAGGRVQEAADLAELVRLKKWPASPVAGFVLPLGLRASSGGDAAAGAFTQMLEETVGVLLVVQSAGDPTGRKALPKIQTLVDALIAKLAGWAPGEEAFDVLRVSRGQLIDARDGRVVYQLDFATKNQVRNLG